MKEWDDIELLRRLVAIPSVNPEHAADPDVAGEGRLAEFLAGWLEGRGFDVSCEDVRHGRPNLVAVHGPREAPRTLLFEAHLDTVGAGDMRRPPFEGRVEEGRLHGRGACDCKGAMAAALCAMTPARLERLAESGWRVLFAGAMGEETGNLGAERLARTGWRADRGIVLEPTDLAIVHAHKGALWLEVETEGLAAHGSNPSRGINAIDGMMRALRLIEEQHAASIHRRRHPLLGDPTLNLGIMHGGVAVNVVPARCVARLDYRILPGEDGDALAGAIRHILAGLRDEGALVSGDVRVVKKGLPFYTPPDSALVRGLLNACERHGVSAGLTGAGWYSDAGPLSAICPDIVVFGPGSIAQAHTADEFIEVESFRRGCAILSAYLEDLAGPAG